MDYPDIVGRLIPLVDRFRKERDLELEGIIGKLGESSFNPGVEFDYFRSLHSKVSYAAKSQDPSTVWCCEGDKVHFARFFFPGDIRGTYSIEDPPVFVKKTPVGKCDIVCEGRAYDIRVNLKRESRAPQHEEASIPDYTRLYERWSFVYKNSWRYDFSKVAKGKTKELACKSPPVFEVELELLHTGEVASNLSSEGIAISIVEKLVDLLGRFDSKRKKLPYELRLLRP